MLPLKTILAATLLLPIADEAPVRKGCAAKKPFNTEIVFNVDLPQPKYNQSMTREQLTNADGQAKILEEWKTEHEDHAWASKDLSVEGVARGGSGVMTRTQMIGRAYDRFGKYYCPYVKKVEINIIYNTQIFIAKERQKGTCEFNATMDHEMRHHEANVGAVKDILTQLKKDLPSMIAFMEKKYIPKHEVQEKFDAIQIGLRDAIEIYGDQIGHEMDKRNKPIDSPEEYERVSNLCPRPQ